MEKDIGPMTFIAVCKPLTGF